MTSHFLELLLAAILEKGCGGIIQYMPDYYKLSQTELGPYSSHKKSDCGFEGYRRQFSHCPNFQYLHRRLLTYATIDRYFHTVLNILMIGIS